MDSSHASASSLVDGTDIKLDAVTSPIQLADDQTPYAADSLYVHTQTPLQASKDDFNVRYSYLKPRSMQEQLPTPTTPMAPAQGSNPFQPTTAEMHTGIARLNLLEKVADSH